MIQLLGVKIDGPSKVEALFFIDQAIRQEKQNLIVTVNPEFLVAGVNNPDFRKLLNEADLSLCDGAGIKLFAGNKVYRVTGVDLVEELLEVSAIDKTYKIFLLGGLANSTGLLLKKYPRANIVGHNTAGKIDNFGNLSNNKEILNQINGSGANIVLVAFGQIKQENWIKKNLSLMPIIKVGIGVGGTFDYLSGNIQRAPKWLRNIGLEWLFRLFKQPKRFGRIISAIIIFPLLLVIDSVLGIYKKIKK
ncbi:MAG: WecB/TagA/CpsF family glycosyltransferase [bacterium]